MSRRVLFDSSVYIQALRERRVEVLQSRTYDAAFVHLSAVVGCELLAGAKNSRSRRELERLWRDFDRAGRLVVPLAAD
jgi:predicted nucleic acid-binding protein